MIRHTCPQCRNGFTDEKRKRKFCSLRCHGLASAHNLIAHRGTKPRTYHLRHRDKHGCAADVEWRRAIFARDDYTCRGCSMRGGRLQAHHIKPYKACPEMRHVLSNGLTLCLDCHKKTDTFGWANYWKSQIAAKRLAQKVLDF